LAEQGNAPDETPLPTARQVKAYLRENPEFLSSNIMLLAELLPDLSPESNVVDLQTAVIKRLRREVEELKASARALISTTRSNMSTQERTHEAALAVLGATDMEGLARVIADDLPVILAVDVVTLAFEPGLPKPAALYVQELQVGETATLLGDGIAARLRDKVQGEQPLFGAGARLVKSDAMVRLHLGDDLPPGILALGTRTENTFHPQQGVELLSFLTKVVGHMVRRWATADNASA
jgi:uncharacterized protein YigA (DUF484 family)